jgi:predicted AlkP superfamily phosphohydrolase/phosphomutase
MFFDGHRAPSASVSQPIVVVLNAASKSLGKHVEKALIYAPDAIGEGLRRDYAKLFDPVEKIAPIEVAIRAVLPTYTPVCFSSMFTGAPPETHGIRKYEKPVLGCDTLFDALARAGKDDRTVNDRLQEQEDRLLLEGWPIGSEC